jgi:hypothetical protein
MRWRLKDIPRTILVGDTVWDVRFVRRILEDKTAVGQADFDEKEILICLGIGKKEQAKTLIHELLHAFECEYKINLPHELIYKLEEPIYRFLCDNCFLP